MNWMIAGWPENEDPCREDPANSCGHEWINLLGSAAARYQCITTKHFPDSNGVGRETDANVGTESKSNYHTPQP